MIEGLLILSQRKKRGSTAITKSREHRKSKHISGDKEKEPESSQNGGQIHLLVLYYEVSFMTLQESYAS